ncbi:hypothetical protein LMG33818_002148 [Halomonadaceae bacterium LMG 33818]
MGRCSVISCRLAYVMLWLTVNLTVSIVCNFKYGVAFHAERKHEGVAVNASYNIAQKPCPEINLLHGH